MFHLCLIISIVLFLVLCFYVTLLLIGMDFNMLLMKLQSMLLGKSLHFLFSRLGWCGGGLLVLAVLCFDPETMGKMMAPSGASNASSSNPLPLDLNAPAVEQEIYQLELKEVRNKKESLADLLDLLIKKEGDQFPHIRKLPSATDVVEDLIQRLGGAKLCEENTQSPPLNHSFRNLQIWLTRACQNAKDETKGRMAIRGEIRSIIQEYRQNDSENSLRRPPTNQIIGTPTPGRVSEPCNRRPFRAVRGALKSAAGGPIAS